MLFTLAIIIEKLLDLQLNLLFNYMWTTCDSL